MNFGPPPEIHFVYKVIYDPLTHECLRKTIDADDAPHIEVTKEEYEQIDFCPNFKITSKNKIVRKTIDFVTQKMLVLSDTGFRTIKGNNMFIVDDQYKGKVDFWDIRINDE